MSDNLQSMAVLAIRLKELSDEVLVSLNLMINGFGRATPGTQAYQSAFDLRLIKEDGSPRENELCNALVFVVNRRKLNQSSIM